MIKVSLVGNGNVSKHLQDVFSKTKGIELIDVLSSRNKQPLQHQKSKPDVYVIAVSDDAIASVSKRFIDSKTLVVHTSGSVSLDTLPKEICSGVFYPLQTFSKERTVDFKTIPICIESNSERDLIVLKELAKLISNKIYEISSEQRKALHLAAVFVNNFTNHLFHIGNEICKKEEIPFEILKPLINETVAKIETLSPINSQTGPAKRNDQETIAKQLKQLQNKNHKEVYQILTDSIKATYGKKL